MLNLTERLGPIAAEAAEDTLTLSYDDRIKGRLRVQLDSGRAAGLFLDRGPVLRDGDGLQGEGVRVRVTAAPEPVVTARVEPGLPLARLCYHLGNRHVTLGIGEDEQGAWVRFSPDHVLEDLAVRLGAELTHHQAPFDPEPGAYSMAGHSHGHANGHHHEYSHDDGHEHHHAH
ncbi:urease accessory protein UreE [Halomonas huangheensis]|uniref:urease accessory protein UreE n=1 Tax=Halomonas huangheensis TaxID=1178482 RepID=UPI0004CF6AB1|nr:urease accessory protein UreE [Halomonas huangheensis]ALM54604.1 urease accessory protein UreE [Halomonas huangheensis]